METQLYYRPANLETAKYLEDRLGRRSLYARQSTEREGVNTSHGFSEQGIPLMTAQEIMQLRDEDILLFHRRLPPVLGKRLDWRQIPLLRQRQRLTPPPLARLQPQEPEPQTVWQYKERRSSFLGPIDPDTLLNDTGTE